MDQEIEATIGLRVSPRKKKDGFCIDGVNPMPNKCKGSLALIQ